jgi:hypothetical protein
MNEKIKELYEQARVTPSYSSDGFLPRYLFEEEELAKFAELIIRECAEYITEYFPHSRYEARQMKKHFGVSE